jgi:hypothetical protein
MPQQQCNAQQKKLLHAAQFARASQHLHQGRNHQHKDPQELHLQTLAVSEVVEQVLTVSLSSLHCTHCQHCVQVLNCLYLQLCCCQCHAAAVRLLCACAAAPAASTCVAQCSIAVMTALFEVNSVLVVTLVAVELQQTACCTAHRCLEVVVYTATKHMAGIRQLAVHEHLNTLDAHLHRHNI